MTAISIQLGLRAFFVVIFVISSYSKVRDFRAFADGVQSYQLLPGILLAPVAVGVVIAEGLIALGFLVGSGVTWPVASAVLAIFTVTQVIAVTRGQDVNCHCFNAVDRLDAGSVARSSSLVFLSLAGYSTASASGSVGIAESAAAVAIFCIAGSVVTWAHAIPTVRAARRAFQ